MTRLHQSCFAVLFACSAWLAAAPAVAAEKLPDGITITSIEALPNSIALTYKFDARQVLLTGKTPAGQQVDVTRAAVLAGTPKFVSVSPQGLVRGLADGEETLTFDVAGHKVSIAVKVTGMTAPYPVSFVRDVQPALSKMGCNAGTCHGANNGKNGFKLSLRGYDPIFDHSALTDDIAGRRVNRVVPEQSLMLLKATGGVPHVGGVRTTEDHPYYQLVKAWIAEGMKLDLDAPRVTKIEIFPKDPIVPLPDMKQQMLVLATYADGATRDVTAQAFIESGDIERLDANSAGLITTLRRGEAPVLARYEGAYAATTITVMGDRSGYAWQPAPSYNYVDDKVYAKLQRVKILPSELCTDDEFVRRLYLDLTGLPPTSTQVREFLADARPSKEKRDALVDKLVGSHEFVEHWTNKWADLLQVNRKWLGEEGSAAFRGWIEQSIAENKPYDRFCRELLTASGSNFTNPPASYWKIFDDPTAAMENSTHLFLSVRFNCNKCHDHPFERWTQDQYYHLSSYFAQVGRKPDPNFAGQTIGGSAVEGAKPLVEILFDRGSGEVTHQRTNQTAPPRFPYEFPEMPAAEGTRREQLAAWITAKTNPYFAKSHVNRLWGYLFGKGIIEPIDDIRAGNPPTNPELLDALTADFIASGFDVQHMFRTICKSRTYQHSVRANVWNADDDVNYARSLPRRLPAEVLYDAIHVAAGSKQRIPGLPSGYRAAELPDAGIAEPFLDDFGRPVRESTCECERSGGIVLGPIIKLVSGPTVGDAISDPNGELAKLVASEPDDQKLVTEVFYRFYARPPTPAEMELGLAALHSAGDERQRAEQALKDYEATLDAKQAEWEKRATGETQWQVLAPSEMKSTAGATFTRRDDGSILVGGKVAHDTYTLTFPTEATAITGLRLEALADPSLAAGGPGRAQNGNFVLSELGLAVAPKGDPAKSEAVGLGGATADFSQEGWPVANAVDGNNGTGWAVSPQFGKNHVATFETKRDAGAAGGSVLTVTLVHQYPDGQHNLGCFRVSITTSPRPFGKGALPANIAAILGVPADQRSPEQKAELSKYYRSLDGRLAELAADVQRAAAQQANERLIGVQDLAWALINSPAFLFNR